MVLTPYLAVSFELQDRSRDAIVLKTPYCSTLTRLRNADFEIMNRIGEALASRFIKEGSTVIVVGRRKEKLVEFVHKHGNGKASAVPFDITELEKIPAFVTK